MNSNSTLPGELRLALAHDHLNQFGGAEQTLRELTRLYPEAPIFTVYFDQRLVEQYFNGREIISSTIQRSWAARRFFKWYLPFIPTAVEGLPVRGYDVLLSSSSGLIKGLITHPGTLHISYCHTPTRYLWTDTQEYIAELPQPHFVKRVLRLYLTWLRQWDFLAAQRVDHFIANSSAVAARIAKYYRRDSRIIHPPVEVDRFQRSAGEDGYYLIVSRLRPYKRIDLAIEAFNHLKIPLVIAGSGEDEARLRAMANPNITFLGQVGDAEKARLLSRCRAFIHPQEEDFGIAAAEALASGRPVIAYRAGGIQDIVTDGESGVLFDEQVWESLADAVVRFPLRQFNAERIQASAQRFSVERFHREIKEFVEEKWREHAAYNMQHAA